MFVAQCKVCNSKHKGIIEELAMKGFSPEKIYEHLHSLIDKTDVKIVQQEGLKPGSIRRHLTRHFDAQESGVVQQATIKANVKKSREKLNSGIKINIDKANTLAHLIELALNNIEEVEKLSDSKKHQYTISYMGQIKGLIDELDKVSGAIKEEGTIDSAYYQTQIDTFAKIVLATIRALDAQFDLHYQLEVAFTEEFKKQYQLFREQENMVFKGTISPKEAIKSSNVNTFNDDSVLV